MKKNKIIIMVIVIIAVALLISSATFAYWTWRSADSANTSVVLAVEEGYSCTADGGGNITPTDSITIVPSTCTNTSHVIKKTIKTNVTLDTNVYPGPIYLNLWLDVKYINSYLAGTSNFKYALTTSNSNCTTGVVKNGSFSGTTTGSKVNLLTNIEKTVSGNNTYYLWIWLDKAETSLPPTGTADSTHNFTFALAGNCTQSTN